MRAFKINKRQLGTVLACITMLFVLATCGVAGETSNPEGKITLVDHIGRTVELPGPAQRVIGTHNPTMNMVVVLDGNGHRIVGFGNKDMAFGLYDLVAPEINEVTQIGRGRNINMETVMAVKPDLMMMPARFASQVPQFEEIGVPCLVLDVEKFESIKSALTLVGKATGQDERARRLNDFFDEKIKKISAIAEKAETKPTVLMLSGSSMTAVSTDAMLQNLMIETAGGINVTAGFQPDELWTDVDIEQIIAWNPEVIYIPVYADYTVEDILNDPKWSSISAVQNRRVYMFPSKLEPWDYPVASSALGLCWTCYNLHPELYSFEDLMADVDEFYQFVYGQTFSAERLGIE